MIGVIISGKQSVQVTILKRFDIISILIIILIIILIGIIISIIRTSEY